MGKNRSKRFVAVNEVAVQKVQAIPVAQQNIDDVSNVLKKTDISTSDIVEAKTVTAVDAVTEAAPIVALTESSPIAAATTTTTAAEPAAAVVPAEVTAAAPVVPDKYRKVAAVGDAPETYEKMTLQNRMFNFIVRIFTTPTQVEVWNVVTSDEDVSAAKAYVEAEEKRVADELKAKEAEAEAQAEAERAKKLAEEQKAKEEAEAKARRESDIEAAKEAFRLQLEQSEQAMTAQGSLTQSVIQTAKTAVCGEYAQKSTN